MREINPEWSIWASRIKTNVILADIYDMLASINANLIAIGTKRSAKRFKPYPRPKQKKGNDNERHFGSKPLPVADLHRWIEEKRAAHAASSTSNNTGNPGTGQSTI